MDRHERGRGARMKRREHVTQNAAWTWPVHLTLYDRNPALSGTEKNALTKVLHRMAEPPFSLQKRNDERLERLSTPISDALVYIHADNRSSHPAIYVLYAEMKRREKAFWAWTVEEWYESIAQRERSLLIAMDGPCVAASMGAQNSLP